MAASYSRIYVDRVLVPGPQRQWIKGQAGPNTSAGGTLVRAGLAGHSPARVRPGSGPGCWRPAAWLERDREILIGRAAYTWPGLSRGAGCWRTHVWCQPGGLASEWSCVVVVARPRDGNGGDAFCTHVCQYLPAGCCCCWHRYVYSPTRGLVPNRVQPTDRLPASSHQLMGLLFSHPSRVSHGDCAPCTSSGSI